MRSVVGLLLAVPTTALAAPVVPLAGVPMLHLVGCGLAVATMMSAMLVLSRTEARGVRARRSR